MTNPSYRGWYFNTANDRLEALYNGVRVFSVDANGLTIVGAATLSGATTFGTPISSGWAITSFTEDKEFAGNSTTAADAVKAVASLVNDLKTAGLVAGTIA
jgi:hypothetical protein